MTTKFLIGLGLAAAFAGPAGAATAVDGGAYARSKQRILAAPPQQAPMQPAAGHAMQLMHDARGNEKIGCVSERNERQRAAQQAFRRQQSEGGR